MPTSPVLSQVNLNPPAVSQRGSELPYGHPEFRPRSLSSEHNFHLSPSSQHQALPMHSGRKALSFPFQREDQNDSLLGQGHPASEWQTPELCL